MRMPPEGEPLKAEEIDAIKEWISGGASSPEGSHQRKTLVSIGPIIRWFVRRYQVKLGCLFRGIQSTRSWLGISRN